MLRQANFFILTIAAAGAVTVGFAAAQWTCPSPARFLACLCLALLGSTFKVKLPGMETSIAPNIVPFLFAASTLSWQETVVMAAVSGALQTLWRPRRPPLPVQVLFNSANLAVAMGMAFAVSHAVATNQILVQVAITVLTFEVVNTLTVSTVVALVTGSPLGRLWRNCHLWSFAYLLGGALLAAVWTQTATGSSNLLNVSITILGAASLYLMSTFYHELVSRAQPVEAES